MHAIKAIKAVLQKDLRIEFRSRYAINTVLAFIGSALLVILFTLKAQQLPPTAKAGLVWIVILFAALSSLSRAFVLETDRYTFDLLRLNGNATHVFLGKLGYNFIFTLAVTLATFGAYIFLLNLTIANGTVLALALLLGTAGFSGVSTTLAGIVAQADRKGAVFSILSIPLLMPLLLVLARVTKTGLIEGAAPGYWNDLAALTGYAGATITAGILLFDYIWEE